MLERDKFFEQRLEKAEALRGAGKDPYNNQFVVDTKIIDFVTKYHSSDKETLSDVHVQHAMAGRVMAINRFGKAAFIRIEDGTSHLPHNSSEKSSSQRIVSGSEQEQPKEFVGRLQLFIRKDAVGDEEFDFFKSIDIGDIIGVLGTPMRTKTGELTLSLSSLKMLTKGLRQLPEKWHGLSDVETRYRQRYLDLIVNPDVRKVFRMRPQMSELALTPPHIT